MNSSPDGITAVDRETLPIALSPSQLTRSRGRGWRAVADEAPTFKVRYSQAYREHQREYHDTLPQSQATLADAKKKSGALRLLNTVSELGEPGGTGLEQLLAALPLGPGPCSHPEIELNLTPGAVLLSVSSQLGPGCSHGGTGLIDASSWPGPCSNNPEAKQGPGGKGPGQKHP